MRTQPDVIVLCHEAGREHVFGLLKFALPSLQDAIHLNLQLARRTMLRRCELEYLEAPGDGGARGSVCLWAIRSAVGTSSTRWSRLV